jgi:hypothetical protein
MTTLALAAESDVPKWVKEQAINRKVTKFEYAGTIYYVVGKKNPDGYSSLYDSEGNRICGWGGKSGKVDGKCPDFLKEYKDGIIIWDGNGSTLNKQKDTPNPPQEPTR